MARRGGFAAFLAAFLLGMISPCRGAPALWGLAASGADPGAVEGLERRNAELGRRVEREKKDRQKPPPPSLPGNALRMPRVRQATGYSCGAASLLSVLNYWQAYNGSESALYPFLDTTPEDGTPPDRIVEVARMFGLRAEARERLTLSDLRAALARGETVVLNLQAWGDPEVLAHVPWRANWWDGHYAVLIGMDGHYAYLMDPAADGGYGYLPLRELAERWHDAESRDGRERGWHQLAILISGKTPTPWSQREELVRVE